MRAAALLGTLLTARVLVILGRDVPLSPWTPLALIGEDVLVALAFLLLDLALRRPRALWALHGIIAIHAAINVPLARVTSTPLTPSMLRAARGTLSDSIAHHATLENLALILPVLLAAALLPLATRRLRRRALVALWSAAAAAAVLGPVAASRIETRGLERNCITALLAGLLPRVPAGGPERAWRESPLPAEEPGDDLGALRGSAAGRSVLIVLLESHGARHVGVHGASPDPTPNLTALAGKGISFESAFCVYPESIKGLFSVLCSIHPALDVSAAEHGRLRVTSLAAVLAGAGYRTGLFHTGRFRYLGMESIVEGRGFDTLEDAGDIGGDRESSFGADEPAAVRRILAWIDSLRGQRFFVTYLPIAGHHPYETPEKGPFPERELIGRYRNALHHGDQALGILLDGLRERGLDREMLLLLAGDHGEAFLEHEGNFGHTFFLHEENIHVPYVIALPGRSELPVRVRRVASLVDTAPTVLDLLGMPAPPAWEGRSLLDPAPRMALFFTDYSRALIGVRDGPWKLIHEIESGRSKLFDISRDPGEREDLSGKLPARVEAYRKHALEWVAYQRGKVRGGGVLQEKKNLE